MFPIEPKAQGDPFESPLRGLDNVILTPHVGGSTQEAQEEIGHFVAGKLATYVADGSTALSVNLPAVQAPRSAGVFRLAHLHDSVPGVLAQINQVLAEEEANVLRSRCRPAASRGTSSPTSPSPSTAPRSSGSARCRTRCGCAPCRRSPDQAGPARGPVMLGDMSSIAGSS